MSTKIFTLSGNHDEDVFLSAADMGELHWGLLMSCHHQGSCDDDCNDAASDFMIDDYFEARDYLVACGIEWEKFHPDATDDNDGDLDEDAVMMYYLWMLSADIQDMQLTGND